MSVNKDRVRLLISALRSGEFEQGTGQLRMQKDNGVGQDGSPVLVLNDDGSPVYQHCCLGVATVLWLRETQARLAPGWGDLGTMPQDVVEWYGFPSDDPELQIRAYPEPGEDLDDVEYARSASSCNDDLRYDFNKIADLFETTFVPEDRKPGAGTAV